MEVSKVTIEEFKNSYIFDRFSSWAQNIIIENYYAPCVYNESGDLIDDEVIDITGLNIAFEKTLEDAYYVFQFEWYLLPINNRDNLSVIEKLKENRDVILKRTDYPCVIWGAVFCFGTLMTNRVRAHILCHGIRDTFTDMVGKHMRDLDQGHEQTWISFYATIVKSINYSNIPDILKTPQGIKDIQALYEDGLLDENYKPAKILQTPQKAHLAFIISNGIWTDKRIRWKIFEEWWNIRNMKQQYNRFMHSDNQDEFLRRVTCALNK